MNTRDKEFTDAMNLLLNQVAEFSKDPCDQVVLLKTCAAAIENSVQADALRHALFNALKPRE